MQPEVRETPPRLVLHNTRVLENVRTRLLRPPSCGQEPLPALYSAEYLLTCAHHTTNIMIKVHIHGVGEQGKVGG